MNYIQHILFNLQCRDYVRQKENRRKRKLTPEQREEEEEEKRRVHEKVNIFIEDEAEESDDCSLHSDKESLAEVGLSTIFSDDEFIDSNGRPFVKVKGQTGRLFKVNSREYFECNREKRRQIQRRALRCHRVAATLSG